MPWLCQCPRENVIRRDNADSHFTLQIFGSGSSPPPLQSGSYMFYALEPSSQYEVVIAGYNDWGWALNSEPFFFSTRATGTNIQRGK